MFLVNEADRYREQEAYCRLQAEKANFQPDKDAWLRVADDWLKLAKDAETRTWTAVRPDTADADRSCRAA